MPQKKPLPPTYRERLLEQLDAIERDYLAVLEGSEIQYVNPNRPGDDFVILTAANWGWAPSGPALESQRMDLLRRLRGWEPRFRLLFPRPTPRGGGEAQGQPGAPGALAGP